MKNNGKKEIEKDAALGKGQSRQGKLLSRVDLGLAISRLSLAPGQTRTLSELAAFCGCTRQNISVIEQRALRKMREGLIPWLERKDNDGLFAE